MSQFWQNLQVRLHPAVPKESTGVPGRKWASGFFSIGSMQKPEERPQGREHEPVAVARAHETKAPLAFVQLAEPRAELALQAAVGQGVPVAGQMRIEDQIGHGQEVAEGSIPQHSPSTPSRGRPAMTKRPPAVAGSFYPADPGALTRLVDGLLDAADPPPVPFPAAALIAPHAGYAWSGPVAAGTFRLLRAGPAMPSRVVVIGRAHHVAFRGIALPSHAGFLTPLGEMPLNLRNYGDVAGGHDRVVGYGARLQG
jgi:hypothetical protein